MQKSQIQYQAGKGAVVDNKKKNQTFPTLNLDGYGDNSHRMNNIPSDGKSSAAVNYKYETDLEKNSDADIFKIISRAYQEKGLEKLFTTEE